MSDVIKIPLLFNSCKKNASTQCNFILLEQTSVKKLKDKGVNCNMRTKPCPKTKSTTSSRNLVLDQTCESNFHDASTQCYIINDKGETEEKCIGVTKSKVSQYTQCCLSRECTQEFKVIVTRSDKSTQTILNTSKDKIKIPETSFLSLALKAIDFSIYPNLKIKVKQDHKKEAFLQITRNDTIGILGGFFDPVKLFVKRNGLLIYSVLFKPEEVININENDVFNESLYKIMISKLSGVGNYVFCQGISCKLVNKACVKLPPSLLHLLHPIDRYQSKNCAVYYEKTSDVQETKKCFKLKQCKECAFTTSYLSKAQKRKILETPTRSFKRRKVTSNYSINNLTPVSKKIRLAHIKQARKTLANKVTKLEKKIKFYEVNLNNDHSKQMNDITAIINREYSDVLEETINDDKISVPVRKVLRQTWERDSKLRQLKDKKDFLSDQIKCKNGKKSNRWSAITLRIALAIYCRSNAAYNALRSFNILSLPCEDTLKQKAKKFHHKPGIDQEYLADQEKKYKAFQDEKIKRGDHQPLGEGVLIFDEVKVIEKVMWNSKSNEFTGFAMSKAEYKDLNDILIENPDQEKPAPSPAQYVLQFLWRDLSSKFDFIGPYFTSASSFQQHLLAEALFSTIEALNSYSFKTIAIVCDGASENLSLIKSTLGHRGPFGYQTSENGEIDLTINPSFENFFCKGAKIHWIVCPSHQLKNIIQALFSSRDGGPKQFYRDGVEFGWREIQGVKRRDEERSERNILRFVPKLLTSYIIRDSWTRLNVVPSKIMQQEEVLSELYSFSIGLDSTAAKRKSAELAYNYLRATNEIFENGVLSHQKISATETQRLDSIRTGFKYFEDWFYEVLEENPDYAFNDPAQSKFLSWQTWDLLRIMVFGFINLSKDFLARHPSYFVAPLRINGSAVESLFSQMKYATGSKLSSINYATARKAVLTKRNVHGKHSSNKNMRDTYIFSSDGV